MKIIKLNAFSLMQTTAIMCITFLFLFALLALPFYNSYKQKQYTTIYSTVYASLIQANRMYSLAASDDLNEYNMKMPINKFAETYFTPYLSISAFCKGDQSACWENPQYRDLGNNEMFDKSLYSLVLDNKAVLGFGKNRQGLVYAILNVDGNLGENKMGKDIFVFYFYNNSQRPKICNKKYYKKFNIQDGIHLGGFDRCGVPFDVYDYKELLGKDLMDACNKKAQGNVMGLGIGSACGAIIKQSNWTIDKSYPW